MRTVTIVAVLLVVWVAFLLMSCTLTPHQQCLADVSRETHRDVAPGLLGQAFVGAINPKPDRSEMLAQCPV